MKSYYERMAARMAALLATCVPGTPRYAQLNRQLGEARAIVARL